MRTTDRVTVDANPYVWPYDGDIPLGRTALINIDWQVDFAGRGGYSDCMHAGVSAVAVNGGAEYLTQQPE
jgi:biuret amidohydrolase